MSKESKTARASMKAGQVVKEKSSIPDVELIRLLRIDVASNLYPSSQGTHALLREYDNARAANKSLADQIERLADFILVEIPGEPSENEAAVDCAIRILKTRAEELLKLDQTATELEQARIAAESELASVRDELAAAKIQLSEIKKSLTVVETEISIGAAYPEVEVNPER